MNTTTAIPEIISMTDLVKRAGSNLATPRVVFERNVYDGTLGNARDPLAAIDGMKDAIMSEFEVVQRSQEYPGYTLAEVQVALWEVSNRREDGVSQPISNDPTITPSTQIVDRGYDWNTGLMRTSIVPAGEMSMPGFRSTNPKKWQPSMSVGMRYGNPVVIANVLRCDQDAVEGIFGFVRDWANSNSIYLGQVVDQNFDFIKLTDFKPENVAITDTLRSKIELFVTGPLLYSDALDERGMPRKSGVFLWGPPGGGKTMAKSVCGYMAARLGAVVVEVDPSTGVDGFAAAATRTGVLLENGHKVVVMMEDMEKLARRDREKVLDILDGTNSKGFRRITIGTTNFLEQIDRAMLRPGRFDAVEFCGLPDLSAFTQLVKVMIAEEDRGDIDFAEAYPYFEGYSYAFISNAVQIIVRAAINRAKGDLTLMQVNTQDLIDAANAVRGHHELLQTDVELPKPALDQLFADKMTEAVEYYMENNAVMTSDYTDYDQINSMIQDTVDGIVEGRLHEASIVNNDGDTKFYINTN